MSVDGNSDEEWGALKTADDGSRESTPEVADGATPPPSSATADDATSLPDGQPSKNMVFKDGAWFYQDPNTGERLIFDTATKQWIQPTPSSSTDDVSSSSDLAVSGASSENMKLVAGVWNFTRPGTDEVLVWSNTESKWVAKTPSKEDAETKGNTSDADEDGDEFAFQLKQEAAEKRRLEEQARQDGGRPRYTDPQDGTTYEWDDVKAAWFPLVDEDFIANYQANYGSYDEKAAMELAAKHAAVAAAHAAESSKPAPKELTEEEIAEKEKLAAMTSEEKQTYLRQKKKERKKEAAEKEKHAATWFDMDDQKNTNVYVTGLPSDTNEEEFKEWMSKVGVIAMDPSTNKLKMKLYRDEGTGELKGDGRCCYVKKESVDLALQVLDGGDIRGHKVVVERAHFEQKGDYDPKKKRKKLNAKQMKRFKERQEALFDWRPEKIKGTRAKSDSTVVLKNLFTEQEMLENAARLFDIQEQVRAECSKWGAVKKITVYDNPEGVVTVTYATPEEADDCITMMNFKLWNKRQLTAHHWDGKTKYKVGETKQDFRQRDKTWEKFLVEEKAEDKTE